MATVIQPTAAPTRKVAAGVTSSGGTALVIWLASLAGLEIPEAAAAAIVTLVGAVVMYFVKERAAATAPEPDAAQPLGGTVSHGIVHGSDTEPYFYIDDGGTDNGDVSLEDDGYEGKHRSDDDTPGA